MVIRPFWLKKIEDIWKKRPIVWLSGVRRVGKTTLTKMLPEAEYYNCDLPSVWEQLKDPEFFYSNAGRSKIIIFDEIHRLDDPSGLLKIAADEFPGLRIIATGSSTLAATKKFRDTLTGRKHSLHLTPVLWEETRELFRIEDFDRRLFHGGLPEMLLSENKDDSNYAEWIDSFYARDIQELFGVRNRNGFLNLFRLIMRQSGGMADYSQLAKHCGLSLPTIKSHLEALSISHAITLLPPFHGGGRREITKRPKIYAFDTGFVSFVNGWTDLRRSDQGLLWEHLVLDSLMTELPIEKIRYWRDKSAREIDFIIKHQNGDVDSIECKLNPEEFNSKSLVEFRRLYPKGENIVVCPNIHSSYTRKINYLEINFCSIVNFKNSF